MTCPRQEREELEKILVGDFGVRAADSHGRRRAEEEDPVRTCFQRDADRTRFYEWRYLSTALLPSTACLPS